MSSAACVVVCSITRQKYSPESPDIYFLQFSSIFHEDPYLTQPWWSLRHTEALLELWHRCEVLLPPDVVLPEGGNASGKPCLPLLPDHLKPDFARSLDCKLLKQLVVGGQRLTLCLFIGCRPYTDLVPDPKLLSGDGPVWWT